MSDNITQGEAMIQAWKMLVKEEEEDDTYECVVPEMNDEQLERMREDLVNKGSSYISSSTNKGYKDFKHEENVNQKGEKDGK